MRPTRPPSGASPASGVLRGVRAGVLAVLCVLLPLAGHVLARGHAPRWAVLAALAAVALPGAVALTRRRLTDTQLLAVLAVAQLAYHGAYSLPGACAAMAEPGGPAGLSRLVEHDAAAGPPESVLLAGHLVTLLLVARLLGLTERLLWRSRSLLTAVRRLLVFLRPLLGRGHGDTGPRPPEPASAVPPRQAPAVRPDAGRAPPRALPARPALSFIGPR
ncbi:MULTISPECIES: hypothetical protein [unclassified Streptomyces]|uniref:hypothetical protein n=1 Tax=unclassified Streptomyces TaxID=2593676 RepID=UPI0037FC5E80